MELRVLIADDEPLARRGLQQLLASHHDCRIVGESRNGRETVRLLRALRPDIAFLDIHMPGLSGFEVLESLPAERPPVVIFATAYDEFALRAFDAHALDYLSKPITQDRFDIALERAREQLRGQAALRVTHQLAEFLSSDAALALPWSSASLSKRIVVTTAQGELVLDPTEVDWIEAEDYYAAIHALGRRHLIRESLASLERRLDPRQFARVHRSAIVRLDRVRELREDDTGTSVVLRDGTAVPVSRRRRERLNSLLHER